MSEYRRRIDALEVSQAWPDFEPSGSLIRNLDPFRSLIMQLREMPFFESLTDWAVNSPIFGSQRPHLKTDVPTLNVYMQESHRLRTAFETIKAFIHSQTLTVETESVFIRLPDSVEFSGILKDCQTIQRGLEQTILEPEIGGQVRLESWEDGSHWIKLCLGTTIAVWFVGEIVTSAAVIRNQWHRDNIFEQQARKYKLEADMVENIVAKQKEHLDLLVEAEARALAEKTFDQAKAAEMTGRLRLTIKDFAEIINRGAVFQPALMPPSAESQTFPDFEKLEFTQSSIKQIEDKKE